MNFSDLSRTDHPWSISESRQSSLPQRVLFDPDNFLNFSLVLDMDPTSRTPSIRSPADRREAERQERIRAIISSADRVVVASESGSASVGKPPGPHVQAGSTTAESPTGQVSGPNSAQLSPTVITSCP